MPVVRGIRGATTATSNTKEAILEATTELLENLIDSNEIHPDDVAAIYFTTTDDLDAEFPAQAARKMGWEYVALMGAKEVAVPGAVKNCIRVLFLINTEKSQNEIQFKYLRGTDGLRNRGMDK